MILTLFNHTRYFTSFSYHSGCLCSYVLPEHHKMFPACDQLIWWSGSESFSTALYTLHFVFKWFKYDPRNIAVKTLWCHFLILTYYQKLPGFKPLLGGPILLSKVFKFMFNLFLSFTSLRVYGTSFRKETSPEEPKAIHSPKVVPPLSQGSRNDVICKANM